MPSGSDGASDMLIVGIAGRLVVYYLLMKD